MKMHSNAGKAFSDKIQCKQIRFYLLCWADKIEFEKILEANKQIKVDYANKASQYFSWPLIRYDLNIDIHVYSHNRCLSRIEVCTRFDKWCRQQSAQIPIR